MQKTFFLYWIATAALAGCVTNASPAEKEKAAIRAVISKETEAYFRQDYEAWKNTFVNEAYFRAYQYWEGFPEKVKVFNGFDTLRRSKKAQFEEDRTLWKRSVEERSNENFRIYPGVAWYTFDQAAYDGTTRQLLGKSVETRILEKHKGEWKIAYLGYHYLPNPKP